MVHVSPPATVWPEQSSASSAYWSALVKLSAAWPTVIGTSPRLVTVTVWSAVSPVGTVAKSSGSGVMLMCDGSSACPVTATSVGASGSLESTCSDVLLAPASAGGVNDHTNVQASPAATVWPVHWSLPAGPASKSSESLSSMP